LSCLGIDLIRQHHMKYKARQIVLVRNLKNKTGKDLRELHFKDKLSGILSEKFSQF